MLGWWTSGRHKKATTGSDPAPVPQALPAAVPSGVPAKELPRQFVSDEPIVRAAQDRFNRAPFAARIADTIARRPDPSSLVVGVFGPWGDGKTSVLKMMEEVLQRHAHVVVVHFNPWHFQSEDQLMRGFFATLADSLDQQLKNRTEKIGAVLKDYGSLLSLGSLSVAGLVTISPGNAAKGLGEALSNVSLEQLRSRIEGILAESGKRVVVLVDDIDRLDRAETHSMFKLVKLSAGFNHTSYVMAFDNEVVAAALGERYGAGGQAAGRAFLEKIIQVPLHLPPVDAVSLRLATFEGVQAALTMAEIELTQAQVDAFSRHFVDGLEPQLSTPRVAKLYTNALMFALPLLKGEVNIMNLMLIEGVRVFFPALYAAIRDNPEVFLGAERAQQNPFGPAQPSAFDQLVDSALPQLTVEERKTVKDRLIRPLFPRTKDMMYGAEWDAIWAKDQLMCAGNYFKRYFSYCVPDGDVSDASVEALVLGAAHADDQGRRALLDAFAQRRAIEPLIRALGQRTERISEEAAIALARTFALNGDFFPQERGMLMVTSRMRAAMLLKDLMKALPAGPYRWTQIEWVLQEAQPLTLALECLRWISHGDDRGEDRNVVESDDNPRMEQIVAQRVMQAHMQTPIYQQFPRDVASLLWLWRKVDADSCRVALRDRFDAHPEEVDQYLDSLVGEGWGLETGLPVRSDLDRRAYDGVERVVGAQYVMDKLALRYGSELDQPERHPPDTWPIGRRVAHQFADIHQHVRQALVQADRQHDVDAGEKGL